MNRRMNRRIRSQRRISSIWKQVRPLPDLHPACCGEGSYGLFARRDLEEGHYIGDYTGVIQACYHNIMALLMMSRVCDPAVIRPFLMIRRLLMITGVPR